MAFGAGPRRGFVQRGKIRSFVVHGRGSPAARRRSQLLPDHPDEALASVGAQAADDEVVRDVHPGWQAARREPGEQGGLPGPGSRLPPQVRRSAVGSGGEGFQFGQFLVPPDELVREDVLERMRRPAHQSPRRSGMDARTPASLTALADGLRRIEPGLPCPRSRWAASRVPLLRMAFQKGDQHAQHVVDVLGLPGDRLASEPVAETRGAHLAMVLLSQADEALVGQ